MLSAHMGDSSLDKPLHLFGEFRDNLLGSVLNLFWNDHRTPLFFPDIVMASVHERHKDRLSQTPCLVK